MSTKIASLHAEIGADVSEFKKASRGVKQELSEQEKALQAWSRQATLEAKSFTAVEKQKQQALARTAREAEKAARDTARAQEQAHQQLVKVGQGTVIVLAAIAAAAVNAYKSFQDYAAGVRDVAIASGTTAEETSTLLQVMDDYGVTAEDVLVANKKLKEKGLTPTLETLAKLSDQFLAIEDPAKRNAFAYEHLGKSATKYFNALNQGGDALRRNASEVNKNLILTDQQIKASEEARLALDAWADAVEGAKVQVGAFLGTMIIHIKKTQDLRDEYKKLSGIEIGPGRGVNEKFEAFSAQMERGAAMTEFYRTQMQKTNEVIETETVEALEKLSKTNASIISDSIALTDSQRDFQKGQEETTAKIAEYEAKLKELFPWETEKRDEILGQIGELKTKYDEDAAAFEQASKKKIAMMTIEKIAMLDGAAGYSEAEQKKAFAVLETLGVVESAAARQAIAMDAVTTAIANGELKVKDLDAALRMMEKGYSIDVVLNTIQQMTGGWHAQESSAEQAAGIGGGFAAGGISSGPESGHMELLHGTEAVIPLQNGAVPVSMRGGMGGVTVNIMLDSATPDPERVAYNLTPAVTRVLRNLGVPVNA